MSRKQISHKAKRLCEPNTASQSEPQLQTASTHDHCAAGESKQHPEQKAPELDKPAAPWQN